MNTHQTPAARLGGGFVPDTNTTPSPAKLRAAPDLDPHKLRPAVANALWRPLQTQAWLADAASNTSVPLPPVEIRTTTPPPERPEPRWEPVNERLFVFAKRADTRLGFGFTATLMREDHDNLLRSLSWAYRRPYDEAIHLSTCERPFLREPNTPTGWRRNHKEPMLTDPAARVLILLAALAIVDVMPPDVEAALLP